VRRLLLVAMAVLWAVPAWAVQGDAGEDLDAQHHDERYGIANVLDYGAVCDYQANIGTANVTDDAVAIQAAIDALDADPTLSNLFFPRACYTTVTIDWEKGTNLIGTNNGGSSAMGNGQPSGGIFCAHGMNANCIVTTNSADDFHHTQMRNFAVIKSKYCTENPTHPCQTTGGGCTCADSTDTLGSGIAFEKYLGEGTSLDRVWIQGFPKFGLEINEGFQGNGQISMLSLWANGQAAPLVDAATADSGATSSLTDTGAFAGLTLDKYYVRITSGTGSGQTRRISSHTDDVLTTTPTWTINPASDSVYSVDHGGGVLIDTAATVAGCLLQSVSGDGNAPALITIVEGSGGEHIGSGNTCVIQNVKAEPGGNTYPQENALRLINSGMHVLLQGVRHRDQSPWGFPAIYFEGKGFPRELNYQGVGITGQGREDYVTLSTMGVDAAAVQIELLAAATGGHYSHEGVVPNKMIVHPNSAPPFACGSTNWRGNKYYDTDLEYECICNGSAWKPVSDPAGTTCS